MNRESLLAELEGVVGGFVQTPPGLGLLVYSLLEKATMARLDFLQSSVGTESL